jgi:CRP-like cAMP-binding protein
VLYTGLVGKDGAVGLTGLGHSITSIRTAVLAPGTAAKISRSIFHSIWSRSAALRELQVRYSELMLCCTHQSAACNAMHDSSERLCTWLLRAHDQLPGERLPFTQQLMADMIGVRRSTVTFFAHELQNEGILRYTRGHINVVNRAELEHKACECYGITRRCADGAFQHG